MEFLNALGVDFKMVFMQAVGFLLLLLLLKKYLFGKIKDAIKARTEEVKETYRKSEEDRKEAEKCKEKYQAKLANVQKEAEEKLQAAVVQAKEVSDSIIAKSHKEAAENMAKAQTSIDIERKRALEDIRNQVVNLTMLASTKLIQKSIDNATAEKLVDDVIGRVEELA